MELGIVLWLQCGVLAKIFHSRLFASEEIVVDYEYEERKIKRSRLIWNALIIGGGLFSLILVPAIAFFEFMKYMFGLRD